MPVTIRPSSRLAEPWDGREKSGRYTHATSAAHLLSLTTADDSSRRGQDVREGEQKHRMVQSSFDLDRTSAVYAAKNGLVFACVEAYNEHHNLVLRPDDVWLAILTQMSTYVHSRADALRGLFVDHAGQERLHVDAKLDGVDHGRLAFLMTRLLAASLRDPALREWALPAFSTTDKRDEAVASAVLMGAMQKYFTYSWGTRCGIPAVTLLGDADDWAEIARRCAARLGSGAAGDGARRWYRVLRPVLDGLVESFRDPDGAAATAFWRGVVDKHVPNGSGRATYSGWVTAFCYWDEGGLPARAAGRLRRRRRRPPAVEGEIPMGFAKVPVTLLDDGTRIEAEILAGSVAIRGVQPTGQHARASGEPGGPGKTSRLGDFDTIQPESGWFLYLT